jgi:hypothetical protein
LSRGLAGRPPAPAEAAPGFEREDVVRVAAVDGWTVGGEFGVGLGEADDSALAAEVAARWGDAGDGEALGTAEQQAYRATIDRNATELAAMIRREDVVILHDPQTAGLIPPLKATGAVIIWRSHVGAESVNEYVLRGWDFLDPFVTAADAYVFSRNAYVPPELKGRAEVIPPSIDPFSPKNQDLAPEEIRAILQHVGLVGGEKAGAAVLGPFSRRRREWLPKVPRARP